ncbi:Hypothetical Protein FCC1311_037202 [Hondaea fermentalgiana]|uniref:Uncharacterized protein n=1 Tax=Hondaea fermentalgiana TaxID=2315210 RepID=A0A2R5G8X8_9STRA|nr:Hypothetical Protein FCC1311_037202 [Hondaea fermentalgiana]|eukprot:GBG27497.1 Hypothetical Protein FCC1311_037202 [Hondaea fermentalgiana]
MQPYPFAQGNPDRWTPHVIVADVGAIGAAEMADRFHIPVVLNSPTLYFSFGDPNQSASRHLPGWGSGFSRNMGFLDRCINVVYPRLMAIALTPDFVLLNQLNENIGLPSLDAQHTIFQGRHMLVNTVIGFEYPRLLEPTVHFVGTQVDATISPRGIGFKLRQKRHARWRL